MSVRVCRLSYVRNKLASLIYGGGMVRCSTISYPRHSRVIRVHPGGAILFHFGVIHR